MASPAFLLVQKAVIFSYWCLFVFQELTNSLRIDSLSQGYRELKEVSVCLVFGFGSVTQCRSISVSEHETDD